MKKCKFDNHDCTAYYAKKLCRYHYNNAYHKQNPNRFKKAYQSDEKVRQKALARAKNMSPEQRLKKNLKQKQWREQNKEKRRLYGNDYQKRKRLKDPLFKLKQNLRTRINQAIAKNAKSGSAVQDLGCTIQCLKTYLEARFEPGMNWNNYGKSGWEIDHIKPLALFDLSDAAELKKACHYTNLQPLRKKDHLFKSVQDFYKIKELRQ